MSDPTRRITIGDRVVGDGAPVYFIAELSANHDHDIGKAKAIIEMAAEAGADAVKLQTYTPDTMTIDSDAPPFRIGPGTLWEGRSLYDLYGEAMTPWEWHAPLLDTATAAGVQLFSTPFDATAADFLDDLDLPAMKIASFELVDLPLIERVAATGRPMIMSTGMATAEEIDAAVAAARGAGNTALVLLRCNSAYPAPAAEMDIATLVDMRERWDTPVGLSDHTLGMAATLAAVTLGACVVEKHVTMSRSEPGPDAAFSLEPAELSALIGEIRDVESALGTVRYGPTPREQPSRAFRRSVFVVEDVGAGEAFTEQNCRIIRPADGLPPADFAAVLGRRARHAVTRGTPMAWDLVEPAP